MKISIEFTTQPIARPDLDLLSREIGAWAEFQGLVREMEGSHRLTGLFYEAYEPMARRRMECHFRELSLQFPCQAVEFIHRLGWVPVGEASLFIRVLSKHRGEALHMLAESIERLKQDVPIWKTKSSNGPC